MMVGNTYPYQLDDWKQGTLAPPETFPFLVNFPLRHQPGAGTWYRWVRPQHRERRLASGKSRRRVQCSSGNQVPVIHLLRHGVPLSLPFHGHPLLTNFFFFHRVIPCGSRADAERIRKYIKDYWSHPNQMKFNDRIVVSTFAGESCRFGTSDLNQGWSETLKSADMPPVLPLTPVNSPAPLIASFLYTDLVYPLFLRRPI